MLICYPAKLFNYFNCLSVDSLAWLIRAKISPNKENIIFFDKPRTSYFSIIFFIEYYFKFMLNSMVDRDIRVLFLVLMQMFLNFTIKYVWLFFSTRLVDNPYPTEEISFQSFSSWKVLDFWFVFGWLQRLSHIILNVAIYLYVHKIAT